ncbi:MAG: DUF1015 family protein [Planctomycetaceae bacterium]|nr:DUF1015 family protein [Planctomycetaceae bacterium]
MVQFRPFSGWRFDLSQVGTLADVVCPLPGEIDSDRQRSLYRLHPCNVVRLVANREEPGDESSADRRLRAADFFHTWRREGILQHEHEDACYVCEIAGHPGAPEKNQWAVILRMRLPETPASSADTGETRELIEQLGANIVPAIGVVREVAEAVDTFTHQLQRMVPGITPTQLVDDDGRALRLWPVTDRTICNELLQNLTSRSIAIVGGKTEFLAACHARDQIVEQSGNEESLSENDPRRSIMTMLTGSLDSGLQVVPEGLIVQTTSPRPAAHWREQWQTQLQLEPVGSDATAFEDAVELATLHESQPAAAVGFADGSWWLASPASTAALGQTWEKVFLPIAEQTGKPERRTFCSASAQEALAVSESAVVFVPPVRLNQSVAEQLASDDGNVAIATAQIKLPVPVCGLVFAAFQDFSGRAGRAQK